MTMAEKSLLIGDAAADTLVRYAALLAKLGSGDAVELSAVGVDGEQVEVTFLLNSGTVMIAETTNSTLPEPDNSEQVEYMLGRIAAYESTGAGFHAPALADEQ